MGALQLVYRPACSSHQQQLKQWFAYMPQPLALQCENILVRLQDTQQRPANAGMAQAAASADEEDDGTPAILCARCHSLTHYGWGPAQQQLGTVRGGLGMQQHLAL
jgi:cytochrome c553